MLIANLEPYEKTVMVFPGVRSAAGGLGLGLMALAVMWPQVAGAAASDLFYERTVMAVADGRCRLFKPEVASALAASQAQAKNAALRAGVDKAELVRIEARARAKVAAEPCASPSIATAAARVNEAFVGYARLTKMPYPGDHQDWQADRAASRSGRVWNLSQTTRFGADVMTFGLTAVNGGQELMAVARFLDGAQPYAARLVMRDEAKSQRPYLDYRRADAKGMVPLAGRVSPRSTTRTFMADARMAPDPLIATPKVKGEIAYRFPAAAARALSGLDPREAVEVEFLFAGRGGQDVVRRAFVEVGDFAAGQAFLVVGR